MKIYLLSNRLAGLCLLMLLATSLSAQVIYDNNAQCTGGNATGSTLSLANFTVPANSRAALVVLIRGTETQTVSSLTFNGQNLSRLGSVFSYFNARAEVWYLAMGNLASPVTSNIDVVWTGNNVYRILTALSAHNVDQTTPVDNLTGNGFPTTATSTSISVAGGTGDLAVEAISCFGPSNLTPPVFTQTSSQNSLSACNITPVFTFRQAAAYKVQTSPTTLSWSVSNLEPTTDAGIQIGANIRAFSPLPVTLIEFTAKPENKTAFLNWETTQETNSERFVIEHSTDSKKWKIVGELSAKGESRELQRYSYTHQKPSVGENYYRLKMVDKDGTFAYSRIQNLKFNFDQNTFLYPNPVSEKLHLSLDEVGTVSRIYILDSSGKQVLQQVGNAIDGISVKSMRPGLYILKIVRRNGSEELRKFVVN